MREALLALPKELIVRVVANFFIVLVCPLVFVAAYWLGYSDGKMTGYVDGVLRAGGER